MIYLGNSNISKLIVGQDEVDKIYLGTNNSPIYQKDSPQPTETGYITFSSPTEMSIEINQADMYGVGWDGTIEYNQVDPNDENEWVTWDGYGIGAGGEEGDYKLYLRGTGNTVVSNKNSYFTLYSETPNISCSGNIETLLDYQTVLNGNHPPMATSAFYYLFRNCTSLVDASNLRLTPTTLSSKCYQNMFSNCSYLETPPQLPATELNQYCYSGMFNQCSSLQYAPSLPATTLQLSCYSGMFTSCTSLITPPSLPATTLAQRCYSDMFKDCYALNKLTRLPATELQNNCYGSMFSGCSSIKISDVQDSEYVNEYRIPTTGEGTTVTNPTMNMFSSTGGTFTGTPSINTTYYTSNDIV